MFVKQGTDRVDKKQLESSFHNKKILGHAWNERESVYLISPWKALWHKGIIYVNNWPRLKTIFQRVCVRSPIVSWKLMLRQFFFLGGGNSLYLENQCLGTLWMRSEKLFPAHCRKFSWQPVFYIKLVKATKITMCCKGWLHPNTTP